MNPRLFLCAHHTAANVISISEDSADWFAIDENEAPSDGEVPLDARFDMEVRGTYFREGTSRYCAYWDHAGRFCFRDNRDQVTPLFQRDSNGQIAALHDSIIALVEPAKKASGALEQGMGRFTLMADNELVADVMYDSQFFLRLYGADFTPFADRTLGSWDFFWGVVEAVENLESSSGALQRPHELDTSVDASSDGDVPISQRSGETCCKDGKWGRIDDLGEAHLLWKGETMPRSRGADVEWVWLGRG